MTNLLLNLMKERKVMKRAEAISLLNDLDLNNISKFIEDDEILSSDLVTLIVTSTKIEVSSLVVNSVLLSNVKSFGTIKKLGLSYNPECNDLLLSEMNKYVDNASTSRCNEINKYFRAVL